MNIPGVGWQRSDETETTAGCKAFSMVCWEMGDIPTEDRTHICTSRCVYRLWNTYHWKNTVRKIIKEVEKILYLICMYLVWSWKATRGRTSFTIKTSIVERQNTSMPQYLYSYYFKCYPQPSFLLKNEETFHIFPFPSYPTPLYLILPHPFLFYPIPFSSYFNPPPNLSHLSVPKSSRQEADNRKAHKYIMARQTFWSFVEKKIWKPITPGSSSVPFLPDIPSYVPSH